MGEGRGVILFSAAVVCLFVTPAARRERELKARLCIDLQSGRSIWAKKWENHESFVHKMAALLSPPFLGLKHFYSATPQMQLNGRVTVLHCWLSEDRNLSFFTDHKIQ